MAKIDDLKAELKSQIDSIGNITDLEKITAFIFRERMEKELSKVLELKNYNSSAVNRLTSDIIKMLLDSPAAFSEKTLLLKQIKDKGFIDEGKFLVATQPKRYRDVFSINNEALNSIFMELINYTPKIGSVSVGAGETLMILGLLKGSDPDTGDIAINKNPYEVKAVSSKSGSAGARLVSTKGDRADPPAVRLEFYRMITEYFSQFDKNFESPSKNEYGFHETGIKKWNKTCQDLLSSNSLAKTYAAQIKELLKASIKLVYYQASDNDLKWINDSVEVVNQAPYIAFDRFKNAFALFQWIYYKRSEDFKAMIFVNQASGSFMLVSTESEMRSAIANNLKIDVSFDWMDKRSSTYRFGLKG